MMIRALTLTRQPVKNFSLLILLAAAVGACSINPVSNLPEVTLITVEQAEENWRGGIEESRARNGIAR